jgi:hypothetical protein
VFCVFPFLLLAVLRPIINHQPHHAKTTTTIIITNNYCPTPIIITCTNLSKHAILTEKNRESVLYACLFSPQRKARLEAAATAAAPSSGKKPLFNNDVVNGSGRNNNNSPFIFNTSNGNENENNVMNGGIGSGTNNNINGSTFNPNKHGNFAVGYGSLKWSDPTTKFS